MEKIDVVEAVGFSGYYEIPGFNRYAITREGRVVNKLTREILLGSINPEGYCHYRLQNDDGLTLTIGRHRLLGYVFKHPGGSLKDLVVNHLNGIPGDDRLDNLEWTTHQGNIEHAGAMGLTAKCTPISVRDADTGVVTKFPSIIECARAFGMTKDAINYRVKAGETRVFPERKQYRASHSDDPWYIPGNIEFDLMANGTSKRVLLRELQNGRVVEFEQLGRLAAYLEVSPATITLWLNQPNQPVLPGLIQIKWSNDPSPWRTVTDPYLELDRYTGKKSVVVKQANTGETVIYTSAVDCAAAMKLNTTTLNYRLKSKGMKIYPDGFSYSYYSDTFGSYQPVMVG